MGWASVSDTVLPLIGVALGTTGTLLGQLLATRVEARRELSKIAEGKRQERKAAIIDFLAAAQHAERIELKIITSEVVDDDQILDAIRDLWLAKKVIELTCSPEVAQTAHDYAWEINKNIHAQSLEVTPHSERERRIAFIETARRQMGYTGEPLVRPGRSAVSASTVQQRSTATVPTGSDQERSRPTEIGLEYPDLEY